jgi:hypothetical protein
MDGRTHLSREPLLQTALVVVLLLSLVQSHLFFSLDGGWKNRHLNGCNNIDGEI